MTFDEIKTYINERPLLKHLGLIALFLLVFLGIIIMWLRFYTNHGQKLEMVDFVGKPFNKAIDIADDKSFELVVADSAFVIGKPGGIILSQNPKKGSFVKEGRKVYVTISKFDPDKISLTDLPLLYGNDFNQKMVELEYRGIKATIKGRKYDPGEPNHILEVYYNNELIIDGTTRNTEVKIDKGGVLECVISDRNSGEFIIPNLVCMGFEEAKFFLEESKLKVGTITQKGTIEDMTTAFILAQEPPYDGITKINMGSTIDLTVVKDKPGTCKY